MNPSNNIQMKDTTDGVVVKADGRTLLAKLVFAGSARLAECDLGIDELRAAFKRAHGEEASKVQISVRKPICGKAAHSNLKIQKIERFLLTCSLSNRALRIWGLRDSRLRICHTGHAHLPAQRAGRRRAPAHQ